MDKFKRCHEITAKWEGGWSDHARDPGGKTMYGITQATLSAWLGRPASATEIRNLSRETAEAIYRKNYWDRVGGDVLPPGVDLCVYDFGVNSGPARGVKSLQAALDVKADGWVGQNTVAAAVMRKRRDVINAICDRRLAFLKELPTWGVFGKGWGNRVNDIRKRALLMAAGDDQPTTGTLGPDGSAKATPAPPVEKTVSTEQKVGGAAGAAVVVTTTLGPLAGFWRDNKDVLTEPMFLIVCGVLAAVVVFLLWRKAKPVELQP